MPSDILRRFAPVPLTGRLFSAILAALVISRGRHRLATLEPHLLRDIGLTPDQAEHEAARSLWDAPQFWRQNG